MYNNKSREDSIPEKRRVKAAFDEGTQHRAEAITPKNRIRVRKRHSIGSIRRSASPENVAKSECTVQNDDEEDDDERESEKRGERERERERE